MKITGEKTLVNLDPDGERTFYVEKNSKLILIDVYQKSDCYTYIELAEGATVISKSLTLGKNNVRIKINHLGKNSSSDMKAWNVVSEKTSFVAKSVIENSGVEANQKINSLLISPSAKINALPILDVKNNEVECSHGCTIGTLDSETLFYMRSRGLNCREAKNAVIQGYVNPFNEYFEEEIKVKL